MRTMSKLVAVALTATLQSAMAAPLVLDFEDQTTTKLLNGSYNGVTISGSAWSAVSVNCSGEVLFDRENSCGALWLAKDAEKKPLTDDQTLTISLTEGFIDAVSFVYSGSVDFARFSVHVYDAAGKELGFGLDNLPTAPCGSGSNLLFCSWSDQNPDKTPTTLSFTGVAHSITFKAADQSILLDNLTFKPQGVTTTPLPEPGSVALAFSALAALGWTRRRSAR